MTGKTPTVPSVPNCAEPIPAQSVLTVPCAFKAPVTHWRSHAGATTDPTVPSGTVNPKWLDEKISTSRRAAKPATCPKCDAATLVGPDHDTCARTARVDPTPADPIREVIARLAGHATYDLVGANLCYREPEHIHAARNPHPILLEHHCAERTLF